MTIAGAAISILTIFYIMLCFAQNKFEKCQWNMLIMTTIVSLFINIGYFENVISDISYERFFEYVYIIIAMINLIRNISLRYKITLKKLFSVLLLFLAVISGFINLIYNNKNLPEVIPMNVALDAVYSNLASTSVPVFTSSNIEAFRRLLVFVLFILLSAKYLRNSDKVKAYMESIYSAFHFFYWGILLEFFFINFISSSGWRETVLKLFGVTSSTLTFSQFRYSFYVPMGFLAEPSYIGDLVLIYFIIDFSLGHNDKRNLFYEIISFIIIFISGSTTSYALIPFGLFVIIKNYFALRKITSTWIIKRILSLGAVCLVFYLFISLNTEFINTLYNAAAEKLGSYFAYSSSSLSGASRGFNNRLAIDIFKGSPALGVGLGTTRALGLIPGVLENFGVAGILAYMYFLKENLYLQITVKNMVLLFIICVYLYFTFTVWYLYMPAFIPVYLAFHKKINEGVNNG